jgi:sugar lactone lactonase YvrE
LHRKATFRAAREKTMTTRECALHVDLVADAHAATGENPAWSEKEQALYWVDIEEPALHRLNPATGRDESWETPSEIGAFALCRSGAVIVALRTGLAKMTLASGDFDFLCAPSYNPLKYRFNDGKCDLSGRFWVGTMRDPLRGQEAGPPAAQALGYFADRAGFVEKGASASIANGIAWSRDGRTMYFTDSGARTIWAYDYDLETATLSAQRLFAQFEASDGTPDGASVDEEGFYWCALYGGGRVLRLSPDGRVVQEIATPVSQPTMCAFGGADYATLYITSAAHGVETEPLAGGVFACRPGVRGTPPALFADD